MKLHKKDAGYYSFTNNGVEVILYLSDDLFPEDTSIEKLKYITESFPIHQRIIGLPDLHFKVKNFVPSGMTIPLKGGFSPMLLGPNNDGMGSVKFTVSGTELSEQEISAVFTRLKKRIAMFRRRKDIIEQDILENILQKGIQDQLPEWGFPDSASGKFEDKGCTLEFDTFEEILSVFPKERPSSLPDFVPGHDIIERGRKCIGILDGTSHFIELFKTDAVMDEKAAASLNIKSNEYFFLVHAGAGDICLLSHRAYLNQTDNFLSWSSEEGRRAYKAFAASANYGFANRLFLYKIIRDTLQELLPALETFEIFSDVPHDYIEKKNEDVFIHRKGAAKLQPADVFEPDSPWAQSGLPYVFPSSAGGDAYIIANKQGNATAFNTVSHGAGRLLPKDSAVEKYKNADFKNDLQNTILLFRYGVDQIEGQHPQAFKNIDKVMQLIQQFNLAQPIARLKPLASLKA